MAGKRLAQVGKNCVACGSCLEVCPLGAISIWKGVIAQVSGEKCVGCGKCAKECPASAIHVIEREVQQ